jgi:MoaA/NifB/PqqE/SkfB family radical SAM enzyme
MADLTRKMKTARENPRLVPGLIARRLKSRFSRHFTALLKGWSFAPETVNIYPTAGCNLKCAMCFVRFARTGNDLGIEQWKKIVIQVKKFHPRIHLSGGEPFIYKNIRPLIEEIRKAGLFLHITTNGTFLEEYAEAILKSSVNQIDISIDGLRETHDQVRGVAGTFDKVLAGLDKLKRAKGERTLPVIKMNSILNFERPSDMEKLLAVMADHGVTEAQFIHPLFLDTGAVEAHRPHLKKFLNRDINGWAHADRYQVKPANLNEVLAVAERMKQNKAVRVTVFPDFDAGQADAYYKGDRQLTALVRPRCAAMWNTGTILANGDLESCPDYVVGNCLETPFSILWNCEAMRLLRLRIRDGNYFSVCRACCFYYQ